MKKTIITCDRCDNNLDMDNEKKKRLVELRDSMKSYGYMDGVEELEDIFPELKESEDERIRKWLIELVEEFRKANPTNAEHNGNCSEAIAYLEKQKTPKKIQYELDAPLGQDINGRPIYFEDFQNSAERSEDEKIRKELWEYFHNLQLSSDCDFSPSLTIDDILAYLERQKEQKPEEKISVSEELYEHIRNACACIDDAMSSDMMCDIADYLEMANSSAQKAFDMVEKLVAKKPVEWSKEDDAAHTRVLGALAKAHIGVLPTKPSQEDIEWFRCLPERFNLQSKLKWSEGEMKVLDSIIDDYQKAAKSFCGYDGKIMLLKAIRDGEYDLSKQEWSEEDKAFLKVAIAICNRYSHKDIADWLKSLRPQPKRESYEEDNVIKNVVSYLNGEYGFNTHYDEDAYRRGLVRQLKSLQPHWKPSEEQMRAVFDASERSDKLGFVLRNLYDDLKKL